MFSALAGMARTAVRDAVRDAVTKAVLLGIALILLAGMIVFCSIALFLYLQLVTGPVLAALGVAGAYLVLLLVVLVALSMPSRRGVATPVRPVNGTVRPAAGAAGGASAAATPEARLAAEAEALGVMLGRNLNGYPLVLTALIAGMMLGRRK